MYFNKRKRAPKILKLLVVVLSLGASICFSADKTDIRVGIIDSFNPEFATTTLEPTLRYLNQKLPNYHFVAVPLNSVNPKKELKNILNNNIFPKDLEYLKKDNLNIKFTRLTKKVENMFSFFDIVYLELTRACNLKCIHCLNNSGIKQKDELTKEDLLKLIKNFSSHGVQEIRFT